MTPPHHHCLIIPTILTSTPHPRHLIHHLQPLLYLVHFLHYHRQLIVTNTPPSPPIASSSLPHRTWKPNSKYYNPECINVSTTHPIPTTTFPTTNTQAIKDHECSRMQHGVLSHPHNIGHWCKWLFRIKGHLCNRSIAKGFLKEHDKDYFEVRNI